MWLNLLVLLCVVFIPFPTSLLGDLKTINFEPLQAGMMGQQVTETLRWHFDDNQTIDKISEVRLPNGTVMHFRFKGKQTS